MMPALAVKAPLTPLVHTPFTLIGIGVLRPGSLMDLWHTWELVESCVEWSCVVVRARYYEIASLSVTVSTSYVEFPTAA